MLYLSFSNPGIEGLRVPIGNPSINTGSTTSVESDGHVFLLAQAQIPTISGNGSALLLSLRGHFVNTNLVALQVWRHVEGEPDWYLRVVKEYEFRSVAGPGVHTVRIDLS